MCRVALLHGCGDGNASGGREFEGIADEVGQNLAESVGVSVEGDGNVVRDGDGERQSFFARLFLKNG